MTYFKTTGVSGKRANGAFSAYSLRGHRPPAAALRYARRHGLSDAITIEHRVSDLSGKGYGGIDARWTVEADIIVSQVIGRDERDDAAAADTANVHDLWDEIEERA